MEVQFKFKKYNILKVSKTNSSFCTKLIVLIKIVFLIL